VEEVEALKAIFHIFYGEQGQEERATGALRLAFHDCVGV